MRTSPPAPAPARASWLVRLLRDLNVFALLVVIAAGAALLLSPSEDDGLLGLPALHVGQEAPRTIKSSREFTIADPDTTERLRAEAARQVPPTYDLQMGIGSEIKARIEEAFAQMHGWARADAGASAAILYREHAEDFMRTLAGYLDPQERELLVQTGFSDEVRDAAIMIVRTVYEQRITEDKELLRLQAPEGILVRLLEADGTTAHEEQILSANDVIGVEQARVLVDEQIARKLTHLTPAARRAVAVLAKQLVRPNLVANPQETQRRAQAARAAVKTVVNPIKPGEVVIRAGERVTERHLFILRGMTKALELENRLQGPAGSAALIVLLVVTVWGFSRRSQRRLIRSHRDLAFLATTYVATLLVLWMGYKGAAWLAESFPIAPLRAWRFAIPASFGVLLVRFVLGPQAAGAFVPLVGVTAGWMMDTDLHYTAYTLIGCFAQAAVVVEERPRLGLLAAGLSGGVAQAAVALALALLGPALIPAETAGDVVAAMVSGLLSAFLVWITVPAVEVLFTFTTPSRLADLANLNHPLLRDLLVQAPGTYHHSIVVGELAEVGARAIGADAALAKVGGYYHDVGKLKNPRAYNENNRGAFSHLTPSEEAAELKRHVAEGLELGAKHRLGAPILEIIAQHHGTGTVRNAYRRALEGSGVVKLPLDPAEFAYAGPKPISREAALILLADVVEVAVEATVAEMPLEEGALEATVHRVVREVVASGQLDACDITLAEVNVAADELASALRRMLMRRGRPAPPPVAPEAPPRLVRGPKPDRPN